MKKTMLRSFLILLAGITIFSSCSKVRDITTSANYQLRLHKADGSVPATAQTAVTKKIKQLPVKDQTFTAIQSDNSNNTAPQFRQVNTPAKIIANQTNASDNTKISNKNLKRVNNAMQRISQNQTQVQAQSKNAAPAKPAASSGKSQMVALILCAALGYLGIHRFYLGYIWQGIVQILLCALCGVGIIWVIIDFVRIIMGTLQPKDGHYSTTL